MRTFFTYCCVRVEAPCVEPPVRLLTNARGMPSTSTPPCSQKRLSSIAMTAFFMGSETWSRGTTMRFSV